MKPATAGSSQTDGASIASVVVLGGGVLNAIPGPQSSNFLDATYAAFGMVFARVVGHVTERELAGVVGVGPVPPEHHGMVVRHQAVHDADVLLPVVGLGLRVHHEPPGEAHVGAGERLAVVPEHPLPQRPGHVHAPVRAPADEPVLLGRDGGGEHRHVPAGIVRGDQPLDHAEADVHQVLAGEWIEDVDFAVVGDAENLPPAGIPATAAAGQRQGDQRNQDGPTERGKVLQHGNMPTVVLECIRP